MSTVTASPPVRRQQSAGFAVLMIVGGGVMTQLLMAISGVIAARMLGVTGRGEVVLVSSLATMASQLTLGGSLPNAITRQLAERRVTARDGLRKLAPRWVLWSLLPAVIAGGCFAIAQRHGSAASVYTLAALTAVMAIQTMASRIIVGAMLGEGTNMVHVALTSMLPQALTVAVLGVAFGLGARWSPVELMAAMLACVLVVLVARLRVLARPTRRPQDELDGGELFRLARRTHIGSVGPLDGLGIDRTLVGTLMGSAQLGLYSAAFALAGLTSILGGCLAMIILPRVTQAQQDPAAERQLVRRWLLMSVVVIASAVAVLDVGAHFIIRVAFGTAFVAAAAVAHWLLIASGLLDFRRVLIAVLQGRNFGGQASIIELALTPFVILGIVLAARHGSLVGAGMTMTGIGVVACLALSVAVARSRPGGRYVPQHSAPARRASRPVPAIVTPTDGAIVEV